MDDNNKLDALADLQVRSGALTPDTVLVPPPKEESDNLLGPHRRRDESWEHYINRRINDAPDANYQVGHQKVQEWVKRHSLPEGVSQQHYNEVRCEERDRMERELPMGLLTVHGYLWRDPYGPRPGYTHCHYAYLDSKGQRFRVDEWEANDRTMEPLVVETPYLLHCPLVGQRPDLNPDQCGYYLTDEVNRLGVMTRSDRMVSLTPAPNLDSLIGKRVRVTCCVEYIRETYYDGDGCYDRVYLTPQEVVEVDIWGRSVEDKKRYKEMFQRGNATIVGFDDELDELASEEAKE